jgi:hypothetical protein
MFYGSQPLAKYSEDLERASFFDEENNDKDNDDNDDNQENSMPRKSGKGKKVKSARGVKFSSGRILLRIPGYGLQRLAPADLVRFIPTLRLKAAAKKVLRLRGISRTRPKRKGSKKGKSRKSKTNQN